MESSDTPVTAAEACAAQTKLDYSTIAACAMSDQGNKLEHEMAQATESLQPPHKYVPWVVVEGKQLEDTDTLLQTVCDAYTGTKPASCPGQKKYLSYRDTTTP